MAKNKTVKSFDIEIFSGSLAEGESEHHYSGENDEWLDYLNIKSPGFDGVISISLEGVWRTAIEQQKTNYTAPVTGYETIVKFGDTMQMKSSFTVKLLISYG